MRRLSVILLWLAATIMTTLPALADEGDPLAESVLLSGTIGWALAGLAVVKMLLFILWTRRGPQ